MVTMSLVKLVPVQFPYSQGLRGSTWRVRHIDNLLPFTADRPSRYLTSRRCAAYSLLNMFDGAGKVWSNLRCGETWLRFGKFQVLNRPTCIFEYVSNIACRRTT